MSKAEDLRLMGYLQHIRDAILRIGRYVEGLDEPRFLTDDKTQDAVIRNLEIIGEASNNITSRFPECMAQHPEIPWSLACWRSVYLTGDRSCYFVRRSELSLGLAHRVS